MLGVIASIRMLGQKSRRPRKTSKRFRRAVSELLDGNQICSIGEWFWLDSRTKPDIDIFVRTILPDGQDKCLHLSGCPVV